MVDHRQFHAHSTSSTDRSDWQGLQAHLLGVAELAAANAAVFDGQAMAWVAGALHDLGKYTLKFQDRLAGREPALDHATWGAHVAQSTYPQLGSVLAYGIAGHHAGLANGAAGLEDQARTPLQARLAPDALAQLAPLLDAWRSEIMLPPQLLPPHSFRVHRDPGRHMFQLSVLARMVFSCLVDADFIDTDNFYRKIEGRPARADDSTGKPTLRDLRARLDQHLAALPAEGGINPLRQHILRKVRGKADKAPGLFSLTVPTGGGKTLASLAFALDHAIAHGLRRVIYVIPFTSIVEQTVQAFRAALEIPAERDDIVLEHHSAFFDDPGKARQAIAKRQLAMENWDAPIVVTTAVQFFESLFADRPSRCRKLHNVAGSVVILDEAQTLPLPLLRPSVALLDELARNYRASLVLCTATQPTLSKERGFSGGLENVRELAPEPLRLYAQLRRVQVRHIGIVDDDALTDELLRRDQVLCIVNNRRHARSLFDAIADAPGAAHLTTLMHARHRSQVLAGLRERLKAGQPCRLVSTSLIEAGVDVDFPTVLRAEAGLESIAQAAGRCNREGRRAVEQSEVLVFSPANPDWAAPKELKLFAEAFRAVERAHRHDLLALEAIDAYFRELYWRLDNDLDRADLLGLLREARPDSLPLQSLASRYRIIQTTMRPVIVPFGPGESHGIPELDALFEQMEQAPESMAGVAARKLQPYLVQVPQQAYDALVKAYAIQAVAPERYGEQFVRLVNPRLYDPRFGLHWEDPQFLRAESLVL